jgi:hypothetical protein
MNYTKNVARPFAIKDLVCCEVIEITEGSQLILGMLENFKRTDKGPSLGLISSHQLPLFYQ